MPFNNQRAKETGLLLYISQRPCVFLNLKRIRPSKAKFHYQSRVHKGSFLGISVLTKELQFFVKTLPKKSTLKLGSLTKHNFLRKFSIYDFEILFWPRITKFVISFLSCWLLLLLISHLMLSFFLLVLRSAPLQPTLPIPSPLWLLRSLLLLHASHPHQEVVNEGLDLYVV